MTDFTDWMENRVIEWLFDETPMPDPPTKIEVSLHSDTPGGSPDGSTEISAAGYSRASVDVSLFTGVGAQRANDDPITFGPAEEDWPQVTHAVLWADHPGGVDPVYHGKLGTARTASSGQEILLTANDVTTQVK